MIKLRNYQIEAVQNVLKDWETHNSVLVVMATGGGKTATFLTILDQVLKDGKRGLVIAHRKELIDQPKDRMESYYPEWVGKIGIMMAGQNETDRPLTIATIQTITSGNRLEELMSNGVIDYVVTDEAHHALADTYIKLYEKMREYNPRLKHLGVTATPFRGDGGGLGNIFEKISSQFGIVELIKSKYLVPVRWLAIQTGVSLEGVSVSNGDFVQSQLSEAFNIPEVFKLAVESHKKFAQGRQGIAFAVMVQDAYNLAAAFNAAGIPAEAADGTTDKKKRQQILDDFSNGKIQVLCNVGLFTEGLDLPTASVIHQLRPTRSDSLYTQMVGRALRLYPGKTDALILDYVPEDDRNVTMLGDILNKKMKRKAVIKKSEKKGDIVGGLTFDGNFKWLENSPVEIISRQLDYLEMTSWSWFKAEDGWMTLGLGTGEDSIERTLVIAPILDGELTMYLAARRDEERSWKAWIFKKAETFDELKEVAEEYAEYRGDKTLAMKKKTWRKQEASPAQISYAERLGIEAFGLNRGVLAQMITHKIAVKAVQKNLQPSKEKK